MHSGDPSQSNYRSSYELLRGLLILQIAIPNGALIIASGLMLTIPGLFAWLRDIVKVTRGGKISKFIIDCWERGKIKNIIEWDQGIRDESRKQEE